MLRVDSTIEISVQDYIIALCGSKNFEKHRYVVLNLGNLGQINPTFLHRIFFNTYFMRINLCIIDRSTSEHGKVQQDRYCKKKKIKKKKTTQATTEIVLTYEQGLGIKSTTPL